MAYHIPALLDESIDGLNIRPGGVYVDATFGGGGHSAEILKRLGDGRLVAFDTDEDALGNAIDDKRLILLNQNFRFLKNNLRFVGINQADGIIADLGVSFHQFDEPSRGFSFREDSVLDMRMSRNIPVKASDLLNSLDEEELAGIFSSYGELPAARKIARSIVKARVTEPVKTTSDLIRCIGHLIPQGRRSKYLARLYQALRIAVNDELGALKDLLMQSAEVLVKGGRLVIITYHSLEDRLVKNFMRAGNFSGEVTRDFYGKPITVFSQVNRKVITPRPEETERNSRCRSARLRIAEKII
ncbi:MAG TPA: 16S rRNA (cytosine(1402)-N(4))-methyltransferase RsmH [Bacteroidales bacterium]|nr:16S rRNA (cytosine(1402)-N(4))-methyltransferase RsmH [Bacteroidales bacterium]HRT90227.1 16S rRNA (cytosine(1402)-N(4))-methyltransferase RsmH [Bacteroidales bacterium]